MAWIALKSVLANLDRCGWVGVGLFFEIWLFYIIYACVRVIYILSTFFVIYFFINSFICIFVLTYNLKNIMQQTKKEYMIIEDTERVIHSSSSENHTSACYGVTEGGYKIRKCLTAPDNG